MDCEKHIETGKFKETNIFLEPIERYHNTDNSPLSHELSYWQAELQNYNYNYNCWQVTAYGEKTKHSKDVVWENI